MNRYLEKLAAGMFGTVLKSVGGAGLDMVKGVGKQLHNATGGLHKDYAIARGITDPVTLSKINGSNAGRVALSKALKAKPEFKNSLVHSSVLDSPKHQAYAKATNKATIKAHASTLYGKGNDFSKLQEGTRRARINVAAIGGAGLVAHHTIQNKVNEIRNRNVQYQY